MFCQVIVDIVHENVAKPFTYLVPEGMHLEAGQRVAVPFGPREKEGVILSFSETADLDPARIKAVLRPLEDYAAIPPELMALAEEMARSAHCPLAETLRLMMPAQMRGGRIQVKTERVVHLNASEEAVREALAASRAGGKRARILEAMLASSPAACGKSAKSSGIRGRPSTAWRRKVFCASRRRNACGRRAAPCGRRRIRATR